MIIYVHVHFVSLFQFHTQLAFYICKMNEPHAQLIFFCCTVTFVYFSLLFTSQICSVPMTLCKALDLVASVKSGGEMWVFIVSLTEQETTYKATLALA